MATKKKVAKAPKKAAAPKKAKAKKAGGREYPRGRLEGQGSDQGQRYARRRPSHRGRVREGARDPHRGRGSRQGQQAQDRHPAGPVVTPWERALRPGRPLPRSLRRIHLQTIDVGRKGPSPGSAVGPPLGGLLHPRPMFTLVIREGPIESYPCQSKGEPSSCRESPLMVSSTRPRRGRPSSTWSRSGVYIPTLLLPPQGRSVRSLSDLRGGGKGGPGALDGLHYPGQRGDGGAHRLPYGARDAANMLELLLSNGAHDCLSCEDVRLLRAAGRRLPHGHSAARLHYGGRAAPGGRLPPPHPRRDPNKCILCFRCIRGCNEVVVNEGARTWATARTRSVVVADYHSPSRAKSSCVACGECVQALSHWGATGGARRPAARGAPGDLFRGALHLPLLWGWVVRWTLHVDCRANRVVKVTGAGCGAEMAGSLCVKGRFGYDFPASRGAAHCNLRSKGERSL